MDKIATIIAEPHILFKGRDGSITAGITLRSVNSRDVCKAQGRQHEWNMNSHTLRKEGVEKALGISKEERLALVAACERLEKAA